MVGNLAPTTIEQYIKRYFSNKAYYAGLDLDDLTQEILTQLLSTDFNPNQSHPLTYIANVGESVMIDMIRRRDREYKYFAPLPPEEPYEEMSILPTLTEILTALKIKPESIEAKAIVLMLQGYNREEVSQELQIPYYSRRLRGLITKLENYLKS